MQIQIHMIQNHAPANLNRDDLGAPKTCYFGGVLRSRISSQCLKRSIRMSRAFSKLLGGVRTRRLPELIAAGDDELQAKVEEVLQKCGIEPRQKGKDQSEDDAEATGSGESKMLIYTTREAIDEMAQLLRDNPREEPLKLARKFAELIATKTAAPDMALSGRMLEPKGDVWKGLTTTIEAALQVGHAFSTHEARPEVDYYVAADDQPGSDAGAAYVDEALFSSACFYKYFSIDWEQLLTNLENYPGDRKALAAHTVGAFIRGAALSTPSGKQNSFAAHNPPDGILAEIREFPLSYANAFADPVRVGQRDLVSQTVAQLGQYIYDLDHGYGTPKVRFWFSPNHRYPLRSVTRDAAGKEKEIDLVPGEHSFGALEAFVDALIKALDNTLD